jgi:hypothetical protein
VPPTVSNVGASTLVTGDNNGVQLYSVANGVLTASSAIIVPFPELSASIPVRIAKGDVNGDGVPDIVAVTGPGTTTMVRVFDGKTGLQIRSFLAFDATNTGGAFVSVGDFDGDGKADIVVSADRGNTPRVRIISGADSNVVLADFNAFVAGFRGGARTAVGDLNHDGKLDLITAAGYGGGGYVNVFDGNTLKPGVTPKKLVADFKAMGTYAGSLFVSAGDLNGDGFADIVVSTGEGVPQVKVISGALLTHVGGTVASLSPLGLFTVPNGGINGARVAVGDFDGDGKKDIFVGSGTSTPMQGWLWTNGTIKNFNLGSTPATDGVYVG